MEATHIKTKIRIAIPSKGRLKQPSIKTLQNAGIEILGEEREYISKTSDARFEVVYARAFDIPIYVHFGAVDLGLTGHDLILEREAEVYELLDLKFGECKLVVAASTESDINSINDLPHSTKVATEYPNLSSKYFERSGRQVEILKVRGTSELAAKLGLAQVIVDISSSGTTLLKNKLKAIAIILNSTCRLACNKIAYRNFEEEISEFLNKMRC